MVAKHTTGLESVLVDKSFDAEVFAHEPMYKHTSYRIGGPARYFIRVDSLNALTRLVSCCEKENIAWTIVGRGTNLLVSDDGFDGVVITLGRDFKSHNVDAEEQVITTGSAVTLSSIVQDSFRASLGGLEFAVGTPGNIGGALRMNAGSADEWIGQRVIDVTIYSPKRGLQKLQGEDIGWGYRSTTFAEDDIILECNIKTETVDPFFIRGKMEANLAKRKKSQPLDMPSCGSVFKNPEVGSAAKMIDELGLKGMKIGGAQVSEKHANFFVNTGNATASDVRELISYVASKVKEAYGVELQPEVRFLGF